MPESTKWYNIYLNPHLVRKRWRKHARKYDRYRLPAGQKNLVILDLCCGNGEFSQISALQNGESTIVGMDFWPMERRKMSELGNLYFVRSSAHIIAARDNAFDHVFIFHSLHHLGEKKDWLRLADELRRVLKPGGRLHLIDHYSSFWLKATFALLRMPFFRLIPQTQALSHQLVLEKDILTYWFNNWNSFIDLLEDKGFTTLAFRKSMFFFYSSFSNP